MAARKRALYIDDRWKEKIQSGVLVKRLTDFAKCKFNPMSDEYMAPHQVAAAVALLKKVMPDMQAVQHQGEVTVNKIVSPEPTVAEWTHDHAEQPQRPN